MWATFLVLSHLSWLKSWSNTTELLRCYSLLHLSFEDCVSGFWIGTRKCPCILSTASLHEQEVVAVLEKESGPGGLHEGTMLLVMGDHGQTLHGDHGGGTSEEVFFNIVLISRPCVVVF
jgi:hypothetical protein